MDKLYSENKIPSGEVITIRTGSRQDAQKLIALKKSYITGTTSIPLYEDEYRNTIVEEAEWIDRYNNQDNSLLLLAEYNGEVIGNIDLTGNQRRKLYHTGMIGMGIHNDWQNKKIGSLLMETTIEWAKTSLLQIVWLEVYASNTAGIKLYEKFGFERCGLIKNFFREGKTIDKITMVKYL
ncbi:GNAT family N-acetyltransferase [Flavobacterium sp. ST-75]|uniref:GNAT family N-acetyltransferase n=1 Tax=Flavobacterium rhizophilum TaxID=3163296 RepID=A0ABW8Y7X5_9FLAO